MIELTQLLSADVIERLGQTLIHSLWQGAVAAVLFGLLLLLIPRTRPNERYVAGCLLLLTLFVLSGMTFLTTDVPRLGPETGSVLVMEPGTFVAIATHYIYQHSAFGKFMPYCLKIAYRAAKSNSLFGIFKGGVKGSLT